MRTRNGIDVIDIGRVIDTPAPTNEQGEPTGSPTFKNGHYVVTVEPVDAWAQWLASDQTNKPSVFFGREQSSTIYQFPSKQSFINAFEQQAE